MNNYFCHSKNNYTDLVNNLSKHKQRLVHLIACIIFFPRRFLSTMSGFIIIYSYYLKYENVKHVEVLRCSLFYILYKQIQELILSASAL